VLLAGMKMVRQQRTTEFFTWLDNKNTPLSPEQLRTGPLCALYIDSIIDVEEIAPNLRINTKLNEEIISTFTLLIDKGKALEAAMGRLTNLQETLACR